MKTITLSIFFCFCITKACYSQSQPFDYFGQTPPGKTPEVFAPGIISIDGSREISIAISPSGDEIFFMRGSGWPHSKIMHMVKHGGKWSMPDTAFFSKDCWATEPAFSPDGQYLYFSTSKGKSDIRFYNLWRIKKNKEGWSEPESIIDIVGDDIMEFHPSIINDGSVYFCYWDYAKQIGDIYFCKNNAGILAAPEKVGTPISTQYNDVDPFVEAAGSYMIFTSDRPGGNGGHDVYISFKQSHGNWGNPINMGPIINTPNDDNSLDISPDDKYLFLYKDGDMYWIEARSIIETLRNEDAKK